MLNDGVCRLLNTGSALAEFLIRFLPFVAQAGVGLVALWRWAFVLLRHVPRSLLRTGCARPARPVHSIGGRCLALISQQRSGPRERGPLGLGGRTRPGRGGF